MATDEKSIHEFGLGHNVSPEIVHATEFYLDWVNRAGAHLGANGWPKPIRLQVGSYVRNPNEHMLTRISDGMSDRILRPSDNELTAIHQAGSSIADQLSPEITLSLIYARALDEVKVRTIGSNTPTQGVNGLMGMTLSETILKRPEPISDEDINYLRWMVLAAARLNNVSSHWYMPKINNLIQAAEHRAATEKFLVGIETPETQSLEELAAANDNLFETMRRLQSYGLKPCIAPALPQSRTKEWLVTRPYSEDENFPDYHPASKIIASLHGSDRPIKSDEINYAEYTSAFREGKEVKIKMSNVVGIENGSWTYSTYLGQDGQLRSVNGRKLTEHMDPSLRAQYEALRSEVIAIYFDAVVPVYITERVKEATAEPTRKILGMIAVGSKKAADLKRLVLARQKILSENIEGVIEELENPNEDVVNKRDIAQHSVVWHIRKLPGNFKASPEARARCLQETGIELAEYGETYVQEHKRGNLEQQSKGYKAIFAAGQMATKMGRKSKHGR